MSPGSQLGDNKQWKVVFYERLKPPESPWWKRVPKWVAETLTVPATVAFAGWFIHQGEVDAAMHREYVVIANDILKMHDRDQDLAEYAASIIETFTPVPISGDLLDRLRTGELVVPAPELAATLEQVEARGERTINMAHVAGMLFVGSWADEPRWQDPKWKCMTSDQSAFILIVYKSERVVMAVGVNVAERDGDTVMLTSKQ